MWNVVIGEKNNGIMLVLKGCPEVGIPAIDWRMGMGIPGAPTNRVYLWANIVSENIVREFRPNSPSANLTIKNTTVFTCPDDPIYKWGMEVEAESVKEWARSCHKEINPMEIYVYYGLRAMVASRKIMDAEANRRQWLKDEIKKMETELKNME